MSNAGKRPRRSSNELRPEYELEYAKAKPNRFAASAAAGPVVVVLDDDIAQVFRTPEAVKAVLRALIETMPRAETKPSDAPAS